MQSELLCALRELRPPFALYEADLHQLVGAFLAEKGFDAVHEKTIARGCRIDFWVGGVGVEIKKGKPQPAVLLRQLARYAESPMISGLIVLSQRGVHVPAQVGGKPVDYLCLNSLWGVALP